MRCMSTFLQWFNAFFNHVQALVGALSLIVKTLPKVCCELYWRHGAGESWCKFYLFIFTCYIPAQSWNSAQLITRPRLWGGATTHPTHYPDTRAANQPSRCCIVLKVPSSTFTIMKIYHDTMWSGLLNMVSIGMLATRTSVPSWCLLREPLTALVDIPAVCLQLKCLN